MLLHFFHLQMHEKNENEFVLIIILFMLAWLNPTKAWLKKNKISTMNNI